MRPSKIISGGQTGVDRASLDFAIERGIPWGGWAPKGWKAEDGTIPERYREHMRECRGGYVERTHRNVLMSTVTLIIIDRPLRHGSGSSMTMDYASKIGTDRGNIYAFRRVVPLDYSPAAMREWIETAGVDLSVVNVAGPRESKAPGIYAATLALLREVWP